MTQPVPAGFPDWGRFAGRAARVYFDDAVSVTTGGVTVGPFFVGDAVYLIFNVFPASFGVRMQLRYRQTDTGPVNLGGKDIHFRGGFESTVCVPVIGPWVHVNLRASGGTDSTELRISSSWVPASNPVPLTNNNILLDLSSTLAAGATSTTDSATTWLGEASYSLRGTAGGANAIIRSLRFDGTTANVHRAATLNAGQVDAGMLMLPYTPVQVRLQNDHSGSSTVVFTLVGRGPITGS